MKHKNLFLKTCVLLVCFLFTGLANLNAQTWADPTPDGSTISSGTGCYLYNVGSKSFLDRGGDYGTQAIVFSNEGSQITPVISSGTLYTLQYAASSTTTLFPAGTSGGPVFTDNSTNNTWNVVLTDVPNNVYSIQVNSTYGGYNASQYLGVPGTLYTANSNRGPVYDVRYNQVASSYTQWKFCSAAAVAKFNAKVVLDKYMKIACNVGSSIDLTTYINTYNTGTTSQINTAAAALNTALAPTVKTSSITNPGFDANTVTGWSFLGTNAASTNNVAELYQKSCNFYQTVSGLSPGLYVLKMQGYERTVASSNAAQTAWANGSDVRSGVLYATAATDSAKVPLKSVFSETTVGVGLAANSVLYPNSTANAKTAFTANLYDNELSSINVNISGSLRIGLRCNYVATSLLAQWICFDNFRLYYYGALVPSVSISKTSFNVSAAPYNTTFDIVGRNLTADIVFTGISSNVTLTGTNVVNNGDGTYKILAANANATNTITATWNTSSNGDGTLNLNSTGATQRSIAITANTDPALLVDNSTLAFTPHTSTRTVTVTGANLTDDVTLAFSNGNFSTVRSLTILKADVMALGGVTFNVDCSATAAATGTLTVTANSITRTINLASSTSDALTINTRSFFVDQSTVNNLQFTVSQGDLYGVSLTAPAGVTLTKTSDGSPLSSITNANVYSGSFGVTATWDGTTRINDGKIRLTTNGQNDSIVVIAIPKNLISSWDGDNNTAATTASYPSAYGWDETTADGVTSASPTWQYYNGSGNIRYVPVTGPGHQYLNKAITFGRSCYFRNWGTLGANKFNLVTPTLTAGVTYQFNGIACLNSNASTGTFTLSVNSAKSNVGTSLGSQSVYFTSTLNASKYSYQFTPVTTSAYYVVLSTDQSADVILSPDYLSIDSVADTRPALHTATNITVDVAGATWSTAFAPSTVNYIVHIPVETTSVTPTVTKAFSGETVTGDGAVTLIDGEGTSTIVVTSQDANSSTTYNFRYTTKSGDATLSNLVVSSGSLKPAFSSAVTSYNVYLANGTTTSSSTATKADAGATVSGDGAITLSNGVATSNILVTAQDGATTKTYTITYSGLALKHSYTFENSDANDSPASGATAVNGTLAGAGSFSDGAYVSATEGDYISLDGSALALATYPAITMEAFLRAGSTQANEFSMLSYFGGNSGANAFWLQPTRNYSDYSQTEFNGNYVNGIELNDAALHHLVSVLTSDSIYLYTDGYLSGKAKNTVSLSVIATTNAYLCKGGYADPTWKGSLYEFNLYTGKMDAATVKSRALAFVPATVYTATGENIISNNKSASEIIVQPGAKLTLNSGVQLAANSITLQSDASGTATYLNNGTTTITTANVQQYLPSGRNWYISSPVTGATSASITGITGSAMVSYNEVNGLWPSAGATLNVGQGYIAVSPTSSAAVTFTGALNDGNQSYTLYRTDSLVQKRGFNLVGNPYPSYLNWESATRTNVGPTMWYRSKDGGQYVFATYGAVSKIGTSLGGTPVTNLIPPMQAFWVRVSGAGSGILAFNNTMRSHSATSNPLKAPTATKATQQVLRLQVSNGVNNDEAIIIFNENAANGFDDYDSPKMTNANVAIPEIYTMVGNEKLVINGLTSVMPNEELALGFTTGQSNSFSIKATQISNFDTNTRIFLRDNLLNTEQELTSTSDYTFTSDVTTTSSRFSVIFKSAGVTTGINNIDTNICISKNTNNQIIVNCNGNINNDATVIVYSASGQKLQTKQITGTSTMLGTGLTSGVYVVTVNNGAKSVTQKVTLN